MRRRRWAWIIGLVSPLVAYAALTYIITFHLVYPTRKVTPDPPEGWTVAAIPTEVGLMPTWESPMATTADRVVILLHGRGGTRYSMGTFGLALAERGYGVVVPALRGQAEGAGSGVSFGFGEAEDILALADDLDRRRARPAEYALFGASMGGTTALIAASRAPKRFRLVVTEGAFVRLDWAAEDRLPRFLHAGVVFWGERFLGKPGAAVNCEAEAKSLRGTNLVMFHSQGDATVSERHAERLEELTGVTIRRMSGPHAHLNNQNKTYFCDVMDKSWNWETNRAVVESDPAVTN
ncbi:MAG: alpha/beta fold hydrolase [Fimbriimonadaceae bacterium]|nr:alpha/beta fold hydrolase [Fimbriimonadaceae bacterium]